MKILRQFPVRDQLDVVGLDIIDFNRLNGCWQNSADAIRTIFSWFNPKNFHGETVATVTIAKCADFFDAPRQADWPGWEHSGSSHVEIGRQYLDWFFWGHPKGELHFSDSPDFYGRLGEQNFWGDIGKVSASAFSITQKGMGANDLWITLLDDGSQQVIIETHFDLNQAYGQQIFARIGQNRRLQAPELRQLRMPFC